MRHPRILDILAAVSEAAKTHRNVTTWWYAPTPRFRLEGERRGAGNEARPVEIVVEAEGADLGAIARALTSTLGSVRVDAHGGAREVRHLFRLLRTDPGARSEGVNLSVSG